MMQNITCISGRCKRVADISSKTRIVELISHPIEAKVAVSVENVCVYVRGGGMKGVDCTTCCHRDTECHGDLSGLTVLNPWPL